MRSKDWPFNDGVLLLLLVSFFPPFSLPSLQHHIVLFNFIVLLIIITITITATTC